MKRIIIKMWCACIAVLLLASCSTAPPSVSSTSIAQIVPPPPPVSSSSEVVSLPLHKSPIDFDKLMAQGEDICAWVKVDGTNIDHPVTMGIDNTYYLTRDAYGEHYAGGAVFIDMINNADFSDTVTVMYGHVMPDDTIFSQLHLFKDIDFFMENKNITVCLPDNCYTYEIFSAFPHGVSNFLYEKDYTNKATFDELLAYIEQREVDAPNETNLAMEGVSAKDKLLLLSTCDNEGGSRYILAARLVGSAA